jgi:MarR-like DNA-binding transcriptional regulator SgrR of sgrS sRNA
MKRTAFQWLVISSLLVTTVVVTGARTRPRYGGTLRVEVSGSLWDPNGVARSLTTESLTKVDEQGRVQPWLAMTWESQNRDRRWILSLRPDVKFHDGTQLTAASVAEILGTCAGCPWKSVQVSGENVVFDFDSPTPLFPAQLAMSHFGIAKSGVNGAPIGTGRMRVTQATPTSATLVAFDSYWNGHSFVESVEVTANRKLRDQWLDLGVGRADVAEVPAEQVRRAQQEHLRVASSRNDELIVLVMNNASGTMQNTVLRQAVAESVDRASLLNFIFQKQGELCGGLLPNWLSGYAMVFPTAQNMQHAKELRSQLTQAPALTMTYNPADASLQLVAERLALSAREAGINIRTAPAPAHWDLSVARVRLNSYHPSVALEDMVNTIGVEHKTPDDTTPDALYQRERELLKSYQLVPLVYVPQGFAANDRVRNWKLDEHGLPDFDELWTEVRK